MLGTLPARFIQIGTVLLIVCGVAGTGFSAEDDPVDRLMEGMASSRGVVANFIEVRHIAVLTQPIETRGRLYFVPPNRMLRETFHPTEARLLVDGDRVQLEQEGQVIDLSGSALARGFVSNFLVLWSGDLGDLRDRYEIRYQEEGPKWEVALTPRDRTLRRVIESITLRGSADGLQEIETQEVDGDRTVMVLDSVERDREFEPAELRRLFGPQLAPEGNP